MAVAPTSQSKDAGRSQNSASKSVSKPARLAPKTKIVVRRLPNTMSESEFLEVVGPLPPHDHFYYVEGSAKSVHFGFSRAYIGFSDPADVADFGRKFDGYVFVDASGGEFPAVVEYAPFQKIPRWKWGDQPKTKSDVSGTYESDPLYQAFLENLNKGPDQGSILTPEDLLAEIENREKELKANNGLTSKITPLIEYVRERNHEKERYKKEKSEERKRRENEKKRQKDDERRRRKDREWEREEEYRKRKGGKRERERDRDREREGLKQERRKKGGDDAKKPVKEGPSVPAIKLLKKPQPPEDGNRTPSPSQSSKSVEKMSEPSSPAKKPEKETKDTGKASSSKQPIRSAVFTSSSSGKNRLPRQPVRNVRESTYSSSASKTSEKRPSKQDDKEHSSADGADGKDHPTPQKSESSRVGGKDRDGEEGDGEQRKTFKTRVITAGDREKRRNKDRPSIAIYRPPVGRRGGGSRESNTTPEPNSVESPSPPPSEKQKSSKDS